MITRLIERVKVWRVNRRPKQLSNCLLVEWDDTTVKVRVIEALGAEWNQEFRWEEVTRVCFSDGGIGMSDLVLLAIEGREQAVIVPTEAEGGPAFMAELLNRELFPQPIFNKAVTSTDGSTLCWPPDQT